VSLSRKPKRARVLLPRLRQRLASQRARILYSAAIAIALSVLTCWVGVSLFTRARDLLRTVPKQLKEMKTVSLRLTASGQQELAKAAASYREHLAAGKQIDRLEAEEHAAMAKAISDIAGFEKALGRSIRVIPGPPPKYDPGEEPTYPWLPDRVAWCVSRDYSKRWNAWYAAKQSCDMLNDADTVFGGTLANVREKYRRARKELDAASKAASDVLGSLPLLPGQDEEMEEPGAHATSALDAAVTWADLVGREAWTSSTTAVFTFLDIPTLFTCLLMTMNYWSRFLLACDRLGPTRIVR
jgi:hypothetical protein